jgi:hypothetical protein
VWFAKARRRQDMAFLIIVFAVLLLTFIGTFCRGPYWQLYWPWEPWPEIPMRL